MTDHPDDAEHIARCDDCQARASVEGLDVDLEKAWTGVAAEAWSSPTPLPETVIGKLLGSPGLARALTTTPSLFLSWILATAAVLAAGTLATPASGEPVFALFAPALAGAGIAYAYGPGVDPAFELAHTMPISDRMVLLVRALAVFGVNAALGVVASLFVAPAVGLTLGWLLPMTTVSALALAVSTLARSPNVGIVIALLVWGMVVFASRVRTGDFVAAVAEPQLFPVYAAVTALLLALALYATSPKREERPAWR